MNFLFIDCETLSSDSLSCAVIDFAAICVNTEKMVSSEPYVTKDLEKVLRFKLSVEDQVKNYEGYKVDSATLDFWQSQSEDVLSRIKPSKKDLTVEKFVENFHSYLLSQPRIDLWFSRGNTFDPIVLYRLFTSAGKIAYLNELLNYWAVRDTRTFIDATFEFPSRSDFIPIEDHDFWNKVFQKHNSSWDVLADVLRIQAILRANKDLKMITR